MKNKILHKATELFLDIGFKSVTMDDLAEEMGISKKTIYTHYENKTKLVEASTFHLFDKICTGIDAICESTPNPIEELYHIKRFVMLHLKNEKSSPQYQLKKYYPKIYTNLSWKQFEVMHESVSENLQRGMDQGIFRKDLDVDFVSRMYFNGMSGIKDDQLFPKEKYAADNLMESYLEYHLRAIVTEKGLETLNHFIQSNR
ncbi:TetR/AcrR family transcriptional regulator [Spongiivirga citrea]|uniref:TetR family transcriptional regulator n=1 Tax=Spongiivirga citrea TaxID=1481457 RepID=A0A6M0CMT6_9FLAO|nr:TetR/AcrR family transcriptional regulator [Spongiivirga citrea]NER18972.1 TetR family transcriptional regulator [Spongiivirga citrea]